MVSLGQGEGGGARAALSAQRAFEIVDLMAASPGRTFTLSELVRRTGVNVASCHAILNVLTRRGHLARHDKAYRLAPAMAAIGAATEMGDPLLAAARAAVAELASRTGLEVLLTARAGDDIIGLARAAAPQLPRVSMRVGQRVPLTPPYGGVFVAWAAARDKAAWAEHGGHDETGAGLHLAALERLRARGYQVALRSPVQDELTRTFASTANGIADPKRLEALFASLGPELYQPERLQAEEDYDVDFLAAPIFDAQERVAFAMSLNPNRGSLAGADVLRLATELTRLCLDVTREHGGRVPARPHAASGGGG